MELPAFLEYLRGRLGNSLRVVQWYRDDDTELIYVRDDLDLDLIIRRGEHVHERLARSSATMEEDLLSDLGEQIVTISVRANAYLLHYPVEGRAGVIVGIETDAGPTLHSFVRDSRSVLLGESDDPG